MGRRSARSPASREPPSTRSSKLQADAGRACAAFHDEHVRNVPSRRIQVDEAWSFVYAKQKNVALAKSAPETAGDAWTWTPLDADTKVMVSSPC